MQTGHQLTDRDGGDATDGMPLQPWQSQQPVTVRLTATESGLVKLQLASWSAKEAWAARGASRRQRLTGLAAEQYLLDVDSADADSVTAQPTPSPCLPLPCRYWLQGIGVRHTRRALPTPYTSWTSPRTLLYPPLSPPISTGATGMAALPAAVCVHGRYQP